MKTQEHSLVVTKIDVHQIRPHYGCPVLCVEISSDLYKAIDTLLDTNVPLRSRWLDIALKDGEGIVYFLDLLDESEPISLAFLIDSLFVARDPLALELAPEEGHIILRLSCEELKREHQFVMPERRQEIDAMVLRSVTARNTRLALN